MPCRLARRCASCDGVRGSYRRRPIARASSWVRSRVSLLHFFFVTISYFVLIFVDGERFLIESGTTLGDLRAAHGRPHFLFSVLFPPCSTIILIESITFLTLSGKCHVVNHADPVRANYRSTFVLQDGVEYDLIVNYSGALFPSFLPLSLVVSSLGLENPESLELWLRIEKQLNELADIMEGVHDLHYLLLICLTCF